MKKNNTKIRATLRKVGIELAVCTAVIGTLALIESSSAYAGERTPSRNDTTLVHSKDIRFEGDTLTTKAGETKVSYVVSIDGKVYPTNKTTATRFALIKRHGGECCLVYITNKTGKTRVTAL